LALIPVLLVPRLKRKNGCLICGFCSSSDGRGRVLPVDGLVEIRWQARWHLPRGRSRSPQGELGVRTSSDPVYASKLRTRGYWVWYYAGLRGPTVVRHGGGYYQLSRLRVVFGFAFRPSHLQMHFSQARPWVLCHLSIPFLVRFVSSSLYRRFCRCCRTGMLGDCLETARRPGGGRRLMPSPP